MMALQYVPTSESLAGTFTLYATATSLPRGINNDRTVGMIHFAFERTTVPGSSKCEVPSAKNR